MAIKINNQDLQARYINGNSIGKVMLNGGQIRPETVPPTPDPDEYIRYSFRPFNYMGMGYYVVVPTWWIWHDGNYGCPYNWDIRIGSWAYTNYTWVSSDGGAIYIHVNSSSTVSVRVKPVSDSYWWALAFSWHWVYNSNPWDLARRVDSIYHDTTYKWYAVSSTNTWDYFRAYQYEWVRQTVAEVLPDTVTTIGNHFREGQYKTWWYFGQLEVMPNSVVSIGNDFRKQQYYDCKNTGSVTLSYTPQEAMSSNVTTIWDGFRDNQFWYSDMIYQPWVEVLPNGLTTIGDRFRYWQYNHSTLSVASAAIEVLPDSVTSIWEEFRSLQYRHSWITNIRWWKDLAIGNADYRLDQFLDCTVSTITVLSDVWYPMASRDQTAVSWGWLQWATVNVPNAYLSNFVNSTLDPRDKVYPKTLFVWY